MNCIEDEFLFHKNDIIVVGCSAGPDSMALVDMLLKLRDKYSLSLVVAHVNHNLREQSLQEENYLREYCKKNKIMFECMMITEYGDDNFHNEARNIRYDFFEKVVYKYHAMYLMTAHHGDDLIETILMRISRGSNLRGYSGFRKIVDMGDYKIIRPLLSYTKQELEDYDKKNHVMYYIDDSNYKDKYTRNRYRKYILPFLKEEDANIHLKYLKFSRVLNDANQFIEKERDKALGKVIHNNVLDVENFKKLDSFIQKEVLYYMMNEYYQDDLILINDKHIELLLNLIYSNRANAFINLPNEVVAIKTYHIVELKKVTTEITTYEVELSKYVELPNHHVIEEVDDLIGTGNDTCRLSSKEISLPLTVRTRKFGDRMSVKGSGTKKIKDIFIDKKVKVSDRDLWPVVVDAKGVIVWLPGLKKSKYDKKKSENYDIILRYS
ncbi:MAG TPA: tRNA lysidine(34) synthetase TilS [Candidatus Faecimonas gallistercoris]|nr:tRNA lysidine(34) synthetase TilS [Candidatus Faecimonas gallistercoris]